ncbi:HNH endonuclease [Shewanella sp. NFH-SH190041]|uniref:HNH endonuclease n=1 Tax=Shewanella sp. NFH-SH190041 TaxID=2950245 RepID=UPI0021C41B19|nr:HNH endonuclease domain-containing protein [Shewanella sp. NFH-SH190041]BDM66093.1 HNH endonuclease [Shewanella sp. NFH-SH190041]
MLVPNADTQLNFIAYLQRIFVEGDFVATYKFALLHALADICVELSLPKDPQDGLCIPLSLLTEKFIELYWQHSVPYSANGETPILLRQNTGKQSALISQLEGFRLQGVGSLTQLRKHADWHALLVKTQRVLMDGPLWRLQKLAGVDECLLYPHQLNSKREIQLNLGVDYCFRRFHDLVVSMTRAQWLQKIREYPANHAMIGDNGNLENFLFGTNRNSLAKVTEVLRHIQQDNCFYCGKAMREKGQVDHFIPWARYPNDLAHNFVLAHSSCNNNKKAFLAAQCHKDNWFEQNIVQHTDLITTELGRSFTADAHRSTAVTSWAYQLAAANHTQLWLGINQFVGFESTVLV